MALEGINLQDYSSDYQAWVEIALQDLRLCSSSHTEIPVLMSFFGDNDAN